MSVFYLADFALLQEICFNEKSLPVTLVLYQMTDEYKRLTNKDLPELQDEFSKKFCRTIMNEVQKFSEKKRPLINLLVQRLQALRTCKHESGVVFHSV